MAAAASGPRRTVRVRGERRYRLLVVSARASGPSRAPRRLDMVVDPGASLTCLTPEAAADLELDLEHPAATARLSGIGHVTAPIVTLGSLDLGRLIAHNLPVAVFSLPEFLEVDGLLGLDFCDALGITRVTLELDTATLVLR